MYDAVARPLRIEAETPADAASVEALVLAAFGPGRFVKTAERLRERARIAAGYVARDPDGLVVGSVRLWSIRIGGRPALFLGPIAVSGDLRRSGVGGRLVSACIECADAGDLGVLLVGEPPFFSRFGFEPAPAVVLPGPVDRNRVMWRGAGRPDGPVAGTE